MQLCSGSRKYRHEEIVHDGKCPCCALIEEKDDLEKKITDLNAEIEKIQQEE